MRFDNEVNKVVSLLTARFSAQSSDNAWDLFQGELPEPFQTPWYYWWAARVLIPAPED